jgi:hypothetical protein
MRTLLSMFLSMFGVVYRPHLDEPLVNHKRRAWRNDQ